MKKALSFLLFCVLALPLPALGAETAAERTALDQGRAQAAALFKAGKTQEALNLYKNLLATGPNRPEVYYEAFHALRAAGRLEEALYVADLARQRFGDVTGVARGQEDRFVLHGAVRAGILFDSNANQGPSSNLLDLGNWKNVEVDNAKERSSFGAYASANLDMGYKLNTSGSVWAVADTSFFWRGNENSKLDKIDSREWQSGRVAAGLRLVDTKHLFDIRLKAEVFDYEFFNHVTALGPEFRYIYALTPSVHLITAANLDQRAYNQNSDRNGLYGAIGEYARVFFGKARHEFTIGASYLGGGADKKAYRYDGWQGTARLSFNLPYRLTVSPFASFGQEFYKGPATALETRDRRDDRWRTGLDLRYALNESWSIELGYAYTNNDSRSALYTYDQHVVSMGVAWRF